MCFMSFWIKNIIHSFQSGFRKNHCCQTALINLTDIYNSAVDKEETILSVFQDLKKAFNCSSEF